MRLYMANVIFSDTTLPLTMTDHTTTTKKDTRKKNSKATEDSNEEITSKRMRLTQEGDMVDKIIDTGALEKAVATRTKHKSARGLNKNITRNTGVTTRPTVIATG